jgi:chemotaxis protein MotB
VPRVLTIRESDQTSMATVVYFQDGSAELDEAAKKRLRRLLPWIAGKPHKIEIRGHAPDVDGGKPAAVGTKRRVGGAEGNDAPSVSDRHPSTPPQARNTPVHDSAAADSWQFAYARCLVVRNFLEAQGIAPHRLRMSQAGPHEPITTRNDPSWQARNPRVEIFVLSEHVLDYSGTRDERAKQEDSH